MVDSISSKAIYREKLNKDDLRHSLNQRRFNRRMGRKDLDQREKVDKGLEKRIQRLEQIVQEMGLFDYTTIEPQPSFTFDIMRVKYPSRFYLPQIEPSNE